jgi:ribokinase
MDLVGCAERIPVAGETIVGHTFFSAPGGKGANQAYAAARLGGDVAMVGRVGHDEFGRQMRANLDQAGCDTARLLTVPDCTSGIALIFVADGGQNSILIVPGANGRLSPDDVKAEREHFGPVAVVLLQLENPLDSVLEAARLGRDLGAKVILDPAPAQTVPDEFYELIDIWTPNETEASILCGAHPGHLDPEQAFELASNLHRRGAKTVVIKLGQQGCLLLDEGQAKLIPAVKVKAVDTTAAGDVFNAALAVAISEGQDIVAACAFANVAAGASVTRLGAQASAPLRSELSAWAAAGGEASGT